MAEVRVIAGQWRRWRIEVADEPGCRPTPERLRETLFNWLGQDLTGWRVLDAFAGSGALGFEALSRGARDVVWLESNAKVLRRLRDNYQRLVDMSTRQGLVTGKADIVAADALQWLKRPRRAAPGFDLICLDPPYTSPLLLQALPLVSSWLNPGALLYVEWDRLIDPFVSTLQLHHQSSFLDLFELERHVKVGQARAWLYRIKHDSMNKPTL